MTHFVRPNPFVSDEFGYAPPLAGGSSATVFHVFDFESSASQQIARLPKGAVVTDVTVHLVTSFDSVTSAVLDVGIVGDLDKYVDSFNLKGATGTSRSSSASGSTVPVTNLLVRLDDDETIVLTITLTGATTAGAGKLTISYTL